MALTENKFPLIQLNNLERFDDDTTSEKNGYYPYERPVNELLQYGVILLDKPPGPTSHEVIAWIKKLLSIEKAGHSGTLDPGTTGLLPIGLGEGTKALSVLLIGPKEYYAIARLHAHVHADKLNNIMKEFVGEIYQRPPQRSSVRRSTRVRTIYELEVVEQFDRLVLMRIVCQAGTYIRKIIYDIGEILSPGATMIELRRTRVSNFSENKDNFTKLHDLSDAIQVYREKNDENKLRGIIRPVEVCLDLIPAVMIRDTAIDALCHGAQLAVPGVIAATKGLKEHELVGVYTIKGEIVGLAEAAMSSDDIKESIKGIAFHMRRIIMKPGTYPKAWRSNASVIASDMPTNTKT